MQVFEARAANPIKHLSIYIVMFQFVMRVSGRRASGLQRGVSFADDKAGAFPFRSPSPCGWPPNILTSYGHARSHLLFDLHNDDDLLACGCKGAIDWPVLILHLPSSWSKRASHLIRWTVSLHKKPVSTTCKPPNINFGFRLAKVGIAIVGRDALRCFGRANGEYKKRPVPVTYPASENNNSNKLTFHPRTAASIHQRLFQGH